MSKLPSGTVTFLFTDIEGSTRLWQEQPEAMRPALARHDAILRDAIGAHQGHVVKTTGDGAHAVFAAPRDAIGAAWAAQRTLVSESWTRTGPLRVRMGVHTGSAELRDGDYYGPAVNRAARIMAVASGGQILVSHGTRDLVVDDLPDGLDLSDLGEHRLRDLSRTERLYQLCGPGLPNDFPALRSPGGVPGNLPAALTSFVGREADLVEVVDALASARVVTLVGVGGVGKTRLALESAAELAALYRDGVWWCELAGVRDIDAVPDALVAALGLIPRDGLSVTESLLEFLHAKELLLVLDNCEHLTRSVAVLVRKVEETCPGVRVLATSREGLKVGGEQMVMVMALDVPDDGGVEEIRDSDAVRLFVERGRAVRPDFALGDDNAGSVARLCRRLDGLPLAIELAAARLAVLTPEELASRLDQRFRLLTGGERTAVERHQTLRAAVDWSYELLEPVEQELFDRLGVFTGGFTLEAAEVVCAGGGIEESEVLDLLAGLVARSLVVADAYRGETRYRMLETIRQYAQEHLADSTASDDTRRRHARYYTEFAEAVAARLAGPDEFEWEARLSGESGNLHAALNWALDRDDVDLALRLACICEWHGVAATEVGRSLRSATETAVALTGADAHPRYVDALVQAGFDAVQRGDVERASWWADRALASDEERGSTANVLYWSLRYAIAVFRGQFDAAADLQDRVIALHRTSGDVLGLAGALSGQAINRQSGDDTRSRAAADEIVALVPRLASARTRAQALAAAGFALATDEPDRGLALVRSALALAQEVGAPGFGLSSAIAGGMTARNGDTRGALELYAAAIPDLRWQGGPPGPLGAVLASVGGLVADSEPEAAAVLVGGAERLTGPTMPSSYSAQQYRHAIALIDDLLEPQRRAELTAHGRAMDDAEISDYAVAAIQRTLLAPPPKDPN